ncbi:MAG: hypothetical protein Q9228_003023 [Teloschistes exilis]
MDVYAVCHYFWSFDSMVCTKSLLSQLQDLPHQRINFICRPVPGFEVPRPGSFVFSWVRAFTALSSAAFPVNLARDDGVFFSFSLFNFSEVAKSWLYNLQDISFTFSIAASRLENGIDPEVVLPIRSMIVHRHLCLITDFLSLGPDRQIKAQVLSDHGHENFSKNVPGPGL